VGAIVWLGRFRVKSMLGEQLGVVELTGSGLVGDRRYALIDEASGPN
jgi:uncharacterized protein YcbX